MPHPSMQQSSRHMERGSYKIYFKTGKGENFPHRNVFLNVKTPKKLMSMKKRQKKTFHLSNALRQQ